MNFGGNGHICIQNWLNFMLAPILLSSLVYPSAVLCCLSAYAETLPQKRVPPNSLLNAVREGGFVTLTVHIVEKL